jgi:iron complex outermembrane recepter protein
MNPAQCLRPAVCCALLAAAAAAPARAQQKDPSPPPSPPPPRYEETVEVEGRTGVVESSATLLKTPAPLLETPASIQVIPRAVFQAQDAVVLGEALAGASSVATATGFGVFDFFVIRGFDSLSSGLVLVDGAPEPESTFYPLYNVRQVEVLKGPMAAIYGGNPLAGAVHLVRKQPQAGRSAQVSGAAGHRGLLEGALDANTARSDGSLTFRLNAYLHHADSHRDAQEADLRAVNPAVTWKPDPSTRLAASFEYVRADFSPDSGLPLLGDQVAPVPRSRSYQTPFDESRQDVYRVRLDGERRLGGRATLRDKAYLTVLDWESQAALIAGAFPGPAGPDVYRALSQLDDRQTLLGNQLELVGDWSTGRVRHQLLAGFEASRLADDFILSVAALPPINLVQPVETAQPPFFEIPGLGLGGEGRATVIAPYVVDRAVLTSRLTAVAGARLDHLSYRDEVVGTDRSSTHLNPVAGLSLAATPRLSVYASVATAFAPPSSLVVGERRPEESRQLELGVKRSFGAKGQASAAVYTLKKDNVAIPDPEGVTRQAGDQRSRGLELELATEPRPGWLAVGAYAFTDAELTRFTELISFGPQLPAFQVVDRSGNAPPFAPRHVASLWVSRQLRSGLTLGGGARYVAEQFVAADNAFALDSYLLFDAMASYRRGRFKASVNAHNLTDQEYEQRGGTAVSVIPGRPFSLTGRVEITLGPQ